MKVRRRESTGTIHWTAALLLPLAALAQPADLQLELGKCAAVADVTTRVACYDMLARPRQDKPGIESSGSRDEALLAKVTVIKQVQPNKLRITLANGQVWQQTVGKAFFIRTNDTVRIAASGWGRSYRLEVDGHPGFIQVSRLQ